MNKDMTLEQAIKDYTMQQLLMADRFGQFYEATKMYWPLEDLEFFWNEVISKYQNYE